MCVWHTEEERKIGGKFSGMTLVTLSETHEEVVIPFGGILRWIQAMLFEQKEAVFAKSHLMLPCK